ncbi:RNA-directed DNA polymerase [Promicromonospora umidemergens]|uniref:group II intron reverse transcriptase/maturase n=2 Tax=Promicromonospora umidemergens TaxID=629679 RepID=UPI0020A50B5D|nr:group II intron reverse transcriptase/maturase [Promicromonospora umidemergens]MCP2287089.1 RNA-directed DNA polymerase [Promicromonospora umidemergens]
MRRELRGMLDATANRSADVDADWWAGIDWPKVDADVRALRQRIFMAAKDANPRRVRSLQRLMLRSRANVLVAVRRVTQTNKGRGTAGVDGVVVLDDESRAAMAVWLMENAMTTTPSPVRRVHIPKANGKRRPLGIPTLTDRAVQAMVAGALEPEWEARFEPDVYGFRPGRGCHDAIEAIFVTCAGKTRHRMWVLDADLTAAFDNIDHDHLLAMLDGFPAREHVAAWLKAGVMEHGEYLPTEAGTPQGGIISPLLLNIALHGMEEAAGVRRHAPHKVDVGDRVVKGAPVLIRYADDLVALCHSEEEALAVKEWLAAWLRPRGLSFNEDKTRIVHLSEGFDFLGFNIRRYPNGKLLTKPSKTAMLRMRARLGQEVARLNGLHAQAVIGTLNPIIKGWANYYRTGVSQRSYNLIDNWLFQRLWRWALRRHPNKGLRWIKDRYWGRYRITRSDRWVFGDRDTGQHLTKAAWTPIVRHIKVKGRASPDDPALTEYWHRRRRRPPSLPMPSAALGLA